MISKVQKNAIDYMIAELERKILEKYRLYGKYEVLIPEQMKIIVDLKDRIQKTREYFNANVGVNAIKNMDNSDSFFNNIIEKIAQLDFEMEFGEFTRIIKAIEQEKEELEKEYIEYKERKEERMSKGDEQENKQKDIKENKEKYINLANKVLREKDTLQQRLQDLREKKKYVSDNTTMAQLDFEEAELIQEIFNKDNSYKNNQFVMRQIELEQDALSKKIDAKTFSDGIIQLRKDKEKEGKEFEVSYYELEIEKCKKAVELYSLTGEKDQRANYLKALQTANECLEYAREQLGIKPKTQKQSQKTIQVVITNTMENGVKIEKRKLGGVESVSKEFLDGSTQGYSRVILQDGQEISGKQLKTSDKGQNFTYYSMKEEKNEKGHIFTTIESAPLIDSNGNIIGDRKSTEEENIDKGEKNVKIKEFIDNDKEEINATTEIKGTGDQYTETIDVNIEDKAGQDKEKIGYKKEAIGDETKRESIYFTKNEEIIQRITKTSRGTTIEIYKDGQLYNTIEYDANGKLFFEIELDEYSSSIIKIMEQIPEDYIKQQLENRFPSYSVVPHELPDELYLDNSNEKTGSVLESAREAYRNEELNNTDLTNAYNTFVNVSQKENKQQKEFGG